MSLKITVTNEPPAAADSTDNINPDLLAHFREYMEVADIWPFKHQAAAFAAVLADQQLRLVAGTAAGKTLAVALPLFHKMFNGRVPRPRKILFMYPTRALLEDQRQVMDKLAAIYAAEAGTMYHDSKEIVGLIQGGMSRTALLDALTRPLLVSTPDAIYWFFRKTIKYNALLIYGLCQVDEVVVDEAHLFSGLMLMNLKALLDRLQFLRSKYIGANLRVHYLSATPDTALEQLQNPVAGEPLAIDGRSKCGDVLTFVHEQPDIDKVEMALMASVDNLLAAGKQRVLLVCNSARRAHQLFDKIKDTHGTNLPKQFSLKFGLIELIEGLKVLYDLGFSEEVVGRFEQYIRTALPLRWFELGTKDKAITLRAEAVQAVLAEQLSMQHRIFGSALRRASDKDKQISLPKLKMALENKVGSKGDALLNYVFNNYFTTYESALTEVSAVQVFIDDYFEQLSVWTSSALDQCEDGVLLVPSNNSSAATSLIDAFQNEPPQLITKAQSREPLVHWIQKAITDNLLLDENSIKGKSALPMELYAYRHTSSGTRKARLISVGWLLRMLEQATEPNSQDDLVAQYADALVDRGIIGHRYVKTMYSDPDGTLALLYSGSMSDRSRGGLLNLFKEGGPPMLLISTSAIEVGVDFAADAMVSEIGAKQGSNLLQRFGRVGRREGMLSEVHLFIPADKLAEMEQRLTGRDKVDRGEFSALMRELLPPPSYIGEAPTYLSAIQYAINEQIGQVGVAYNEYLKQRTQDYGKVEQLANQMRDKDIDFAYGLRGTLPSISLRDEGVSRDPFYLLSYTQDNELLPAESPFEAARADLFFGEFIYRKRIRDVFVDSKRSIEAATHRLIKKGVVFTIEEIDLDEASEGHEASREWKEMMTPQTQRPLLLYGDIYLAAGWGEGVGPPQIANFSIANQWFVLVPGLFDDYLEEALKQVDCFDLEEVFYDALAQRNRYGTFLLERQTGAAFYVWEHISQRWKDLKAIRNNCRNNR